MTVTNDLVPVPPVNPSKLSGLPILQTVTGDEYVEVIARDNTGAFKNYRVLSSKLRAAATAYDFAVSNGFVGTLEQWLESTHALYTRDSSMYGRVLVADNQGVGQWTEVSIGIIEGLQEELDRVLLQVYESAAATNQAALQAQQAIATVTTAKDAAVGAAAGAADSATQAVDARNEAEGFAETASTAVGQIGDAVALAVAAKDAAEAAVPVVTAAQEATEAAALEAATTKDDIVLLVTAAEQAAGEATTSKNAAGDSKTAAQEAALQAVDAAGAAADSAATIGTAVGDVQNTLVLAVAAKDTAVSSAGTASTAAGQATTAKNATDLAVIATQASVEQSLDARDAAEAFAIDTLTSVTATQASALEAVTAKSAAESFAGQAQQAVTEAGAVVAEGISALADPDGSDKMGFRRSSLAETITTVNHMLSGLTVNIWEYAHLITNKPTVSPSTWDWTPARDAATAAVKASGGGWVKYPAGTYPHTVFTKRHSVSDLGDGSSCTYITALPRTSDVPYGMVEIDKGAVSSSHIVGIHFQGSVIPGHAQPTLNPDQWGLYAKAQWDDAYFHGGWWYSECRDVRFSNFNKGGWTRGGYTNANYRRPIQFLTFDKVFFQVPNGGEALRMTGQHGQIEFRGGSAEGRDGAIAWRCVTLDWDPDPSTMADLAANQGEDPEHLPGQATAVLAPINVSFGSEFSMQKSQFGAYARNVRAIFFHECWFEDIGKLFTLAANARVHVSKNHIANAADGTQFLPDVVSGYLYSLSGNSYLSWTPDNETQGIVDDYLDPTVDFNNIIGLNIKGMPSGNTQGRFKAGSNKTLLVDGTTLDIKSHKYAVFNPGADPTVKLANLTATAAPGETVMIRPLNGTLTLTNTGNISLNGLGNLTVPQFGVVTLLRLFQIGVSPAEWVVVSCTDHYSTVKPVNGFYYCLGTRVWQPGAAPNTPMGWVCTQAGLAGSTAIFRDMPNVGST